jgi:threonine dehydrogenase-like Zn-dependent dehydrogenase
VFHFTPTSGSWLNAVENFFSVLTRRAIFGVPHMDARVTFDHFRLFRQEISIISSYTSLKNSMQAIDLMKSKTIRVDDLVSHQIKLSECPEYIKRMEAGDGELRKVAVTDFAH